MHVFNVHERILAAPASEVAPLLDGLGSPEDALWPRDRWPAMTFDRPLQVGAVGGHGPIRYVVESYEPGTYVLFRFTAPRGFDGYHCYDVTALTPRRTRLRHVLEMDVTGRALVTWPLVFRPLHDALIEDSLDRAELYVGSTPLPRPQTPYVRILRWMMRHLLRARPLVHRRGHREG